MREMERDRQRQKGDRQRLTDRQTDGDRKRDRQIDRRGKTERDR